MAKQAMINDGASTLNRFLDECRKRAMASKTISASAICGQADIPVLDPTVSVFAAETMSNSVPTADVEHFYESTTQTSHRNQRGLPSQLHRVATLSSSPMQQIIRIIPPRLPSSR
jgi:hypothetical protein